MVSILWGVIAFSLGLLIYLLPPVLAPLFGVDDRVRIGRYYFAQAMRSFRQVAIVRKLLSGYELLPLDVDDSQRLAKVTLSSGLISDDKELPFRDPANTISRLFQKPIAIVPEHLPAAVDPRLAEWAHWDGEQAVETGVQRQTGTDEKGLPQVEVDLSINAKEGLRITDPKSIVNLAGNGIEPENVKTAEEETRARFTKYGSKVGVAETAGMIMGFAIGLGGAAAVEYLNTRVLADGGGGGGGPTNPIPMTIGAAPPIDATPLFDLVVMLA